MKVQKTVPPLPMTPHAIIATDGACLGNPGPGGWAFVFELDGELVHTSGGESATTNNRMEALAIIQALSAVTPGDRVCILSDSEITVRGLNEWRQGWKSRGWKKSNGKAVANLDLWLRLDELASNMGDAVSFHWVRGHAGHLLNEEADTLANAAAAKASMA